MKFGQIRPWTVEFAAIERLENPHRLIMRVKSRTLLLSILDGSFSFLQIRTPIKAWMSLKFVKIPSSPIMELDPLSP